MIIVIFLVSGKPNNNNDSLIKFKIFNIVQKAQISEGSVDDIHKNLELIENVDDNNLKKKKLITMYYSII